APGTPSATTLDTGTPDTPAEIGGVTCPTTSQCTAIDGTDAVITFNPTARSTPSKVVIDAGAKIGLTALACPSATQCSAIRGAGKEITFDPTTSAAPTSATCASSSLPIAVACPTATQCTVVDQAGSESTFNPQTPGTIPAVKIDSEFLNNLFGLACRSAV